MERRQAVDRRRASYGRDEDGESGKSGEEKRENEKHKLEGSVNVTGGGGD